MVDTTQILLIVAITIMTLMLTVIGIQLILVLRDARRMMNRFNRYMDNVEKFGINITSGYSEVVGFVAGLKRVVEAVDHFTEKKKKHAGTK